MAVPAIAVVTTIVNVISGVVATFKQKEIQKKQENQVKMYNELLSKYYAGLYYVAGVNSKDMLQEAYGQSISNARSSGRYTTDSRSRQSYPPYYFNEQFELMKNPSSKIVLTNKGSYTGGGSPVERSGR